MTIAISTYVLVTTTTVAAQEQIQERLMACDRISNAETRLECFNAVVGGIKSDVEPEPPTAMEERPETPAASVPPSPAAVEAAPIVPAAVVEEAASRPATNPASTVPDNADVPPVAAASGGSEFGLEDLKAKEARQAERERKKEEQFEAVYSTIVEVRRITNGRFEARLENGQVWRETEATRTVRRPKVGDSVRITSGRLGSYRMKFNNDNRLASVRRTQ